MSEALALALAGGHNVAETLGKRRWRTPWSLFDSLHREFHFDFDASAEDGRLVRRFISPADDCLVAPWARYGRRAWFNPPWGIYLSACAPRCRKGHKRTGGACVPVAVPGTGDFVDRVVDQVWHLDLAVVLLPTARDASWWVTAYYASTEVRLLPRIAFCDADTLDPYDAPPAGGCTVFVMRPRPPDGEPRVVLADVTGAPLRPSPPSRPS